jgi:putative oxidoreductase
MSNVQASVVSNHARGLSVSWPAAVSLVGRFFISYIFVTSGLAKIFDWSGNVQYMSRHQLPMIPVLLAGAMLIELGGSICLISGYQAQAAALVMAIYLIIVTLWLHNYWAYSGDAAAMQETHFRKNLAIIGGLFILHARGPGWWAVNRRGSSDTLGAGETP